MSPSSSSSNTIHDCYDHYELKTEETHFSCDGCKMNGFGPRYTCNFCGDKLHKECRNPKPTISHDFFGCSTFSFIQKPFTKLVEENPDHEIPANYCNACGKDICGFSYHCEPRNLNLHPCCRSLEKMLKTNDGMVFDLMPKPMSKCLCCENKSNTNSETWAYVSSCKKYHFNVNCMMERVNLAKIKNGESGKADISDLQGRSSSIKFFEESVKPVLITVIDIGLDAYGKHGIEVLKKVTLMELLLTFVQKCLIDESTRKRMVLLVEGSLKNTKVVLENASLHDCFEAAKNSGSKLFESIRLFFKLIAEIMGKLIKRKDLVPEAEGVDRMV